MIGSKILRRAAVLTLFFFVFFTATADFSLARAQEDDLTKAQKLYQKGDYERSIKLLGDFIEKLKSIVEQKKNVAEAFYLLAKIYFEVGDDAKVDENLAKVFETYPTFSKDESNFGFKERVDKAREAFLKVKEQEARKMERDLKDQQQEQEVKQPPKAEPDSYQPIMKTKPRKKKKKFPILLVVGGIALVAVLVLVLGKKKKDEPAPEVFDIRGDWTVYDTVEGDQVFAYYTFAGNLNSGTFVDHEGDYGTYTVNGRSVTFVYDDFDITFNGNFSSQDQMNGTWDSILGNRTWRAVRGFVQPMAGAGKATQAKAMSPKRTSH